jgi:hypothetical protein
MGVGSGMTDIDPKSVIELHTANERVVVQVPLTESVTGEWLRCYQRLARATGVPAPAQAHPDRAWIVVSVSADGNQGGPETNSATDLLSVGFGVWVYTILALAFVYWVLYPGFTNATAFSPTDVMPLSRWAKTAMTMQAASSLAVLGLVIARAVNILQ